MEVWKAVILGIVQGLTEFLPISSSGHLIFFQELLNVDLEAGAMFLGVMLHIGTLIAVIVVFFKDIIDLFRHPKNLLLLIIASIPAAVVGILFGDKIDAIFYGGKYLCYGFLITGILLLVTEIYSKKYKGSKDVTYKTAAVMGLFQAVAVLPGISRSGSTISGGVFTKTEREKTANFTFLMSLPVIGGAALLELVDVFKGEVAVTNVDAFAIIIGMLAAAVCGFLAIKLMLKIIKKANYKWFSVYLFVMAIVSFLIYNI